MRATAALREERQAPPAPVSRTARLVPVEPIAEQKPWRHPADMPVAVHGLALACWGAFLGVFWITFAFSGHATFMVAISTVYAVMFFGVPTNSDAHDPA